MRFTLPILALAAVAAPAAASNLGEEVVDVRIVVGDLDLSSVKGRAELNKRIDKSLTKACTIEANSRYGYGRDIVDEKCVADARTAALAKAERLVASRARAGGQASAN